MTTPPGPRPPGSPGDCDALAAVCDAYAGALESEVRSARRVHDLYWSNRWTGRAADHVQEAVSRWREISEPAAYALRDLAAHLRRTAADLEHDQAAWRRRADAYAEAVRDRGRWGPT
jgi:uncharacterized protein YukE